MFRDFDQSTFSLGLQGFQDALYITNGNMSDSSQADIDHNFYLINPVTSASSPYSRPKLKNISGRVKTPIRIQNMTSRINETHDGSF